MKSFSPHAVAPSVQRATFTVDPFQDYRVALTLEGGIAMTYKTSEDSFARMLLRIALWTLGTGLEAWLLLAHSPAHHALTGAAALVIGAIVNFVIVSKPVEMYRTIEIRSDCLILDGNETFLLANMSVSWPELKPAGDGFVLCGIYGTRFVEYLTITRLDEYDRAPEVLRAHLQYAMQQLWTRPY